MRSPVALTVPKARWFLVGAFAGAVISALAGCSGRTRYTPPTSPMPPNTILLSEMMQQLSAQPGFTEAVLREIDKGGKNGPALLTPRLADTLRKLILGKDWEGLNRFPGWTMRQINPTVGVAGRVLGKDPKVDGAANPGPGAAASGQTAASGIAQYIDLGPYPLDRPATVDLDQPSTLPGFEQQAAQQGSVAELGAGVTRGDGPDPTLAPSHSESARLAYLLNRLSLNGQAGVSQVLATIGPQTASTPPQLVHALAATGHTVTVVDARYFANFGHFHYKNQDVMMPFWVNSEIMVPGTHRPLLVPVTHTEYEWFVQGPNVNAAVAFYFGIDGKAQFRTTDERNQPWVLGRHAHTYTGGDAIEVTRLTSLFVTAYIHAHQTHPDLPFSGYYALGVCQDAVAAIEKRLTGQATLFPNTAEADLFSNPEDAEISQLIAAIPKDRDGRRPEPERIFGSLPTTDLRSITIPGLNDDLLGTQAAWQGGTLRHTRGQNYWVARALEAFGVALAAFVVYKLRRRASPMTRTGN